MTYNLEALYGILVFFDTLLNSHTIAHFITDAIIILFSFSFLQNVESTVLYWIFLWNAKSSALNTNECLQLIGNKLIEVMNSCNLMNHTSVWWCLCEWVCVCVCVSVFVWVCGTDYFIICKVLMFYLFHTLILNMFFFKYT